MGAESGKIPSPGRAPAEIGRICIFKTIQKALQNCPRAV
jgi:hypothetical protein